jgi:hypothetical protein
LACGRVLLLEVERSAYGRAPDQHHARYTGPELGTGRE